MLVLERLIGVLGFEKMKKQCQIFSLSGPSGVGKSTLLKAWLDTNKNLKTVVSHTTRPQRVMEKDGADYHFISKQEFDTLAQSGEFLDYREIYGNYYGLSKVEILKNMQKGNSSVIELDVAGALKVSNEIEGVTTIYLDYPNKESLKHRVINRGGVSQAELEDRINQYEKDSVYLRKFDYLVNLHSVEYGLGALENIYRELQDG